jgi:hypothetical protein
MDDTLYNDSNRAFLQAFLARSTMTFEEARPVLAAIFTVLGRFAPDFHRSSVLTSCRGQRSPTGRCGPD